MRRSLSLLAFSVVLVVSGAREDARAQGIAGFRLPEAEVEISGEYTSMRAKTVISGTTLNLNGASLSLAYYPKPWIGVAGDLGRYDQGNIAGSGFSLSVSSYQVGPRVRMRNRTRLTPFGQLLLGAGIAGGTLYTSSLGSGEPPLGASSSFLLTAGAGADWRLSPGIEIRLIQAEFLRSQFVNGSGNRQENLRLSSGVVFSFGNH
jgi:outer membrane immunogenic protein